MECVSLSDEKQQEQAGKHHWLQQEVQNVHVNMAVQQVAEELFAEAPTHRQMLRLHSQALWSQHHMLKHCVQASCI